jgi:AAA family ATP:ADP antiporter
VSTSSEQSAVERFLGIFAEVRAGEGKVAILLALNVFFLLTAYYLVKPVREALILALDSGAEYKSYMSVVIAALLFVLVPIYAKLADGTKKSRLVIGATLFFASHLVVFWLLDKSDAVRPFLGLVFFAWVGVFNMMVVAQFWAYANDVYDPERGKRLFPIVALGASVGAAIGAKIAALLIPVFGVMAMLLVASLVLGLCAFLFEVTERSREATPAKLDSRRAEQDSSGAFALVFRHRYLLLLAAFALIFSWVSSNGEYMFGRLVKEDAAQAVERGELAADAVGAHIGAFFGDFFFYVNVLGVLLQSFVVSRVVKYFGLEVALLVLPVLALGNSFLVLALPVLGALHYGKIAQNATDYSLNNTVRQMLWLPTTEAMKYKAKQAVDTFFVRMGDVTSALLVFVGTTFAWSVRGFAASNAILVVIWLGLAVAIIRENGRFAAKSEAT